MDRRLQRRIAKVEERLAHDPRIGSWDDACWVGRVFGLDPIAVLAEARRLLIICDAEGATSEEEQQEIVRRDGLLRPTMNISEVAGAIAARPHRLAQVASTSVKLAMSTTSSHLSSFVTS
jgi:hypothetical protein